MLSVAVGLRLMEAEARGQSEPTEDELAFAREFAGELGERGDVLMYGGKKGEAAEMFNKLARAVSILSFCPGGVTTFGINFCAKHSPTGKASEGVCRECVALEQLSAVPIRPTTIITARTRTR